MAATLQVEFRKKWREFTRGRPGHRFQSRYERARKSERRGETRQRLLHFGLALVFLAIGAVLSVIPGPAIPFFFLGGGFLAAESRPVARFLDGCEVVVRKVVAWGKRRWKRLQPGARIAVMILGVGCSAGMAYLTYQLVVG